MNDRHLRLKFEGKQVGQGRIPLNLFQKVTKGVQSAIYQIGEYHNSSSGSRDRGRYSKDVVKECTLELVNVDKGSFIVDFELPITDQGSLIPDLGEESINSFVKIIESLSNDNMSPNQVIKDRVLGQKILRTVNDIIPKDDDYSLVFSANFKALPPLTNRSITNLSRFLTTPILYESEIIGQVVEIRIVEDRYFGVLNKNKIIKCYFDEVLESNIVEAMGKHVRITGEALVDDGNVIRSLRKVHDIQIIETGNMMIDQIKVESRGFILTNPLTITIDTEDNLWRITQEELGIDVLEDDFESALHSFYEEFAMIWDEYVLEEEENLTQDAIQLKNRIQNYVKKVVSD